MKPGLRTGLLAAALVLIHGRDFSSTYLVLFTSSLLRLVESAASTPRFIIPPSPIGGPLNPNRFYSGRTGAIAPPSATIVHSVQGMHLQFSAGEPVRAWAPESCSLTAEGNAVVFNLTRSTYTQPRNNTLLATVPSSLADIVPWYLSCAAGFILDLEGGPSPAFSLMVDFRHAAYGLSLSFDIARFRLRLLWERSNYGRCIIEHVNLTLVHDGLALIWSVIPVIETWPEDTATWFQLQTQDLLMLRNVYMETAAQGWTVHFSDLQSSNCFFYAHFPEIPLTPSTVFELRLQEERSRHSYCDCPVEPASDTDEYLLWVNCRRFCISSEDTLACHPSSQQGCSGVWIDTICECVKAEVAVQPIFEEIAVWQRICTAPPAPVSSLHEIAYLCLCDVVTGDIWLDGPLLHGEFFILAFLKQLHGRLVVSNSNLTVVELPRLAMVKRNGSSDNVADILIEGNVHLQTADWLNQAVSALTGYGTRLRVWDNPRLCLVPAAEWLLNEHLEITLSMGADCPYACPLHLSAMGSSCTNTCPTTCSVCSMPKLSSAIHLQETAACSILLGPVQLENMDAGVTPTMLNTIFGGVTHILGPLVIRGNPHLRSLSFMRNLQVLGGLTLSHNAQLLSMHLPALRTSPLPVTALDSELLCAHNRSAHFCWSVWWEFTVEAATGPDNWLPALQACLFASDSSTKLIADGPRFQFDVKLQLSPTVHSAGDANVLAQWLQKNCSFLELQLTTAGYIHLKPPTLWQPAAPNLTLPGWKYESRVRVSWLPWVVPAMEHVIYQAQWQQGRGAWKTFATRPTATLQQSAVLDRGQLSHSWEVSQVRVVAVSLVGDVLSISPSVTVPRLVLVTGAKLSIKDIGSAGKIVSWPALAPDFLSHVSSLVISLLDMAGNTVNTSILEPSATSVQIPLGAHHLLRWRAQLLIGRRYPVVTLPLSPACDGWVRCRVSRLRLLTRSKVTSFTFEVISTSEDLSNMTQARLQVACGTVFYILRLELTSVGVSDRVVFAPVVLVQSVQELGCIATLEAWIGDEQRLYSDSLVVSSRDWVDSFILPPPVMVDLGVHLVQNLPLVVQWPPYAGTGVLLHYELVLAYATAAEVSLFVGQSTQVELDETPRSPLRYKAVLANGSAIVSAESIALTSLLSSKIVDDTDSDLFLPLVTVTGILLVLLVAVTAIVGIRWQRQHVVDSKNRSKSAEDSAIPPALQQALRRIHITDPKHLPREIDISSITIYDPLGAGQFGQVHKALLDERVSGVPEYLVAVKRLQTSATAEEKRDFLLEAALMAQLNHENVAKLIGQVTKHHGSHYLVMAYCEHGCLLEFLLRDDIDIGDQQLINWAVQICSGLLYLSGQGYLHRDIAARNMLLDTALTAKIADFGLTRHLDAPEVTYISQIRAVPVRWSAPEVLASRVFSVASDVWSYGVLLYELFGFGEKPYLGWNNEQVWAHVSEGYRLPRPEACPVPIYRLMLRCWVVEPQQRPGFGEMLEALKLFLLPAGGLKRFFRNMSTRISTRLRSSLRHGSTDTTVAADGPCVRPVPPLSPSTMSRLSSSAVPQYLDLAVSLQSLQANNGPRGEVSGTRSGTLSRFSIRANTLSRYSLRNSEFADVGGPRRKRSSKGSVITCTSSSSGSLLGGTAALPPRRRGRSALLFKELDIIREQDQPTPIPEAPESAQTCKQCPSSKKRSIASNDFAIEDFTDWRPPIPNRTWTEEPSRPRDRRQSGGAPPRALGVAGPTLANVFKGSYVDLLGKQGRLLEAYDEVDPAENIQCTTCVNSAEDEDKLTTSRPDDASGDPESQTESLSLPYNGPESMVRAGGEPVLESSHRNSLFVPAPSTLMRSHSNPEIPLIFVIDAPEHEFDAPTVPWDMNEGSTPLPCAQLSSDCVAANNQPALKLSRPPPSYPGVSIQPTVKHSVISLATAEKPPSSCWGREKVLPSTTQDRTAVFVHQLSTQSMKSTDSGGSLVESKTSTATSTISNATSAGASTVARATFAIVVTAAAAAAAAEQTGEPSCLPISLGPVSCLSCSGRLHSSPRPGRSCSASNASTAEKWRQFQASMDSRQVEYARVRARSKFSHGFNGRDTDL